MSGGTWQAQANSMIDPSPRRRINARVFLDFIEALAFHYSVAQNRTFVLIFSSLNERPGRVKTHGIRISGLRLADPGDGLAVRFTGFKTLF